MLDGCSSSEPQTDCSISPSTAERNGARWPAPRSGPCPATGPSPRAGSSRSTPATPSPCPPAWFPAASPPSLAGVHVGGVWRRQASGWTEVVPAEADDHQVVAEGDVVAVAAAVGVGQSDDGGVTWTWSDEGLHAPYCRAAAVADGWLLATASTGPGTS